MPTDPTSGDLVVLGAGPAGLAAAWYAGRRGFTVTVLDHASRVGGLAGSTTIDGQRVDFGSHRLHPSIRSDLLEDLRHSGVQLQWRPRNGRIRLHGRWLAFPLSLPDLIRHSSIRFGTSVAWDTAVGPVRRRRADRPPTSFDQAVRLGLGPAAYDSFYGPYARKLWGVDGAELSSELFRRRVSAGTSTQLVRKLLRPHQRPGFWYPTRGFGAISESLAAGISQTGGTIQLESTVAGLTAEHDGVIVELTDGRTVQAQRVVSTIPAPALLRMLNGPRHVVEAADRLRSRAAVLVYLTVPRPRYTDFDAHYFPQPDTIVARLSEPKRYRDTLDDPADRTVLCAEIPATVGDSIWTMDDSDLARRVSDDLTGLGLPDPRSVSHHVNRRTHVYPIYQTGWERDHRLVESFLDEVPRLTVVGRQATFAHDNTHHALLMGKTVAELLRRDGAIDAPRWAEARRAFADHVVED